MIDLLVDSLVNGFFNVFFIDPNILCSVVSCKDTRGFNIQ